MRCNIHLDKLTDADFICNSCSSHTATSAARYLFSTDLTTSGAFVEAITRHIASQTPYVCKEGEGHKKPDLRVLNAQGQLVCRLEAKYLSGKPFVKASQMIGLKPCEALVVDLPKLLSYFQCLREDRQTHGKEIPIYVLWHLNRTCEKFGGITVFQAVSILKRIFDAKGLKPRAFTRKSGEGDVIDGIKVGITDKYHFSLRECRPIEDLLPLIQPRELSI